MTNMTIRPRAWTYWRWVDYPDQTQTQALFRITRAGCVEREVKISRLLVTRRQRAPGDVFRRHALVQVAAMLAGDAILTFPCLIGFTHTWQAQIAGLDLALRNAPSPPPLVRPRRMAMSHARSRSIASTAV